MAQSKKSLKEKIKAAEEALWAKIRFDYENKGTALRELARHYGIKAHTTIGRRVNEEGWSRNENSISAHMATEGVLDHLEAQDAPDQVGANRGAKRAYRRQENLPKTQGKIEQDANFNAVSSAGAEQSQAVTSAKKIANQQKQQLLKEIAVADMAITSSTLLLGTLKKSMETDDPVQIISFLQRFSFTGKNESFSSLMRAAISGLKEGVNIRRRALGMDIRQGYGQKIATSDISVDDLPEQVKRVLPGLSTEQLLEMKRVAEIMNKKIEMLTPPEDNLIDADYEDVSSDLGA